MHIQNPANRLLYLVKFIMNNNNIKFIFNYIKESGKAQQIKENKQNANAEKV